MTARIREFAAGEDPEESFKLLKSAIVLVQVKDGVQGIGAEGESVLPGTGEVPMKPLLQKLRAIRFGKPVSLEWERMWEPSLPALDVALSSLYRNWLR